jgi:hypothetical protein
MHSAQRSATSWTRWSAGRKREKSFASRASSQATCAWPPSRAHAAAISVGNAARLLPVAAGDADQARVVGVAAELLLERRHLVQQPTDLVRDEALVDEAGERRRGLRAGGRPLRRHHRPLVPPEHPERALEIVDLGQTLLQIRKRSVHREQTYP